MELGPSLHIRIAIKSDESVALRDIVQPIIINAKTKDTWPEMSVRKAENMRVEIRMRGKSFLFNFVSMSFEQKIQEFFLFFNLHVVFLSHL